MAGFSKTCLLTNVFDMPGRGTQVYGHLCEAGMCLKDLAAVSANLCLFVPHSHGIHCLSGVVAGHRP